MIVEGQRSPAGQARTLRRPSIHGHVLSLAHARHRMAAPTEEEEEEGGSGTHAMMV
jgi:hypothetical protein